MEMMVARSSDSIFAVSIRPPDLNWLYILVGQTRVRLILLAEVHGGY